MKSLLDPNTLDATIKRLEELTPEAKPLFGSFSPHMMLCHLIDSLEICFGKKGEIKIEPSFFTTLLGRWFVISSPLPWPKGKIETPPMFLETKPDQSFEHCNSEVIGLLEQFRAGAEQDWGTSPAFGKLSPEEWGKLQYRHTDHHLRQFGC